MRWGLIVRAETDRGLGIQTLAMYENLKPDKTLVVLAPSGRPVHLGNYPDATTATLKVINGVPSTLDEQTVRDWWSGLDVVVTVETFYDWRLIEWARADGVRTIVHGNPEFWMATNPQPDTWWYPTTWRIDKLPAGVVIPVPVNDDIPITARPANDGDFRVMHIAGNAMEDRNGTNTLLTAMRRLPSGVDLTLYHQSPIQRVHHSRIKTVRNVVDRWSMYADHHALVLPRRYGGLCLPVLEAMACGLAVFMSDCSPNLNWPVVPVASDLSKTVAMQTGPVETYETAPNVLANTLKHFTNTRSALEAQQAASREWAYNNRWSVLKERYYAELDIASR